MLEYLTLLIVTMMFGLILVSFHKIRKIHLASYNIASILEQIYTETNNLYPQLQCYIDLKTLLQFRQPLPKLRGWAASPDFLLMIAQYALINGPETVVECSSGASTMVLARCMQMNGKGHVYSLEHDAGYSEITKTNLKNANLKEWATIIDAPLKKTDKIPEYIWYSSDKLAEINNIDMLVIDGPPMETSDLARFPAGHFLFQKMTKNGTVFLDDADRESEKKIVELWMNENTKLQSKHLPLEKGCIILNGF